MSEISDQCSLFRIHSPISVSFTIWDFFREYSQFTGQQVKGEAISLTPLLHFYLLHRNLNISQAITGESSPLDIAYSQSRTGSLWFWSASC